MTASKKPKKKRTKKYDLAEECADCLVMISQLRILIPGFSAKVDRVMHEKIERQINRISKEQQC